MAVQSRSSALPSFSEQQSRLSSLHLTSVAAVLDKQNVGDLSMLLRNTELLPQRYVIPEAHRPCLSHDDFLPEVQLPVIDLRMLSSGPEELESLVEQVGSACKDWGFFQIVGHGVSQDLIKQIELEAWRFFKLPYQQKEKAAIFPRPLGYNGRYKDMSSSAPWVEALAMQQTPESTVDSTINAIWSKGNNKFRKAIWSYHAEMDRLAKKIVELLSLSLGLERSTISRHFEKNSTMVRWNHYPPCPLPSQALGLHAHSDPSALTVLHQDSVGGLQIKKDGTWIAVKPRPDSLIVNIGDLLQVSTWPASEPAPTNLSAAAVLVPKAWTNGRYRSVEHRAVVNREQSRFSMVFFYGPEKDVLIQPPAQLIDDENPVRYRPFTWAEYQSSRLSIEGQGKTHIDVFAGLAL